MFTISILNYENGNDPSKYTESVIQTIPSSKEGELKLISPVVKHEMGNAETFDFSIEGGTKFYDAFKQMKTYVTVKYDNDYIFSGRVLTVDTTFYGTRRIRCEGALSFLGDTPVEAVEESKRKKVWTSEYVYNLLADHNYWVGQGPRYMIMSEVPGNYSELTSKNQQIKAEQRTYGSDGNSDTKSTLEDLRSYYGGYFRTRVAPGGIQNGHYLDWMDHYFSPEDPSTAAIELGKNIIDFSSVTEVDNIFTIIIPIGKKTVKNSNTTTASTSSSSQNLYLDDYLLSIRNYEAYDGRDTNRLAKRYISVPTIIRGEIYNLASLDFSYDDLNSGYHSVEEYANATTQFGWIYKTVTFDTASSQEELFKQAMKWIKNNYSGAVTKFTIKAIDMHQIGENTRKIMVGDRVKIIYPITDESGKLKKATITLTCLSASYDLYNPENNSYTFGKPANMLTKTYGIKKTGKSVDKGSNAAKDNRDEPTDKEAGVWLQKVRSWLFNHKIHYSGEKPYVSGDSNQSGPYFIEDSYGGYTLQKCVPQHYTPGYGTDSWDLSSTIFFEDYSDITEVEIFNSGVISYVYTEYGVNLQDIGGTSMPTEAYSNDGTKFTFKKLAESLIPKNTVAGVIPFITSEYKPNTGVLMYKACKTINFAVKEATNNSAPKIVGRSVFNEAGDFIVSKAKSGADFNNELYSDAVKIISSTGDVRYLSKEGDEKSIQDLEDTVNNNVDGLVKKMEDAGISVGLMRNALNILGATDITPEMADMIAELEMNGITVNALTNKVNIIGATVGDETSGLIKRLYDDEDKYDGEVTLLTQAINIIGGSDITPQMATDIENLARKGISVTALTAAVNVIGTSKYTPEVGQKIQALANQGLSVTALTSDVVVCEGRLDGHDAKLETITADWVISSVGSVSLLNVQSVTGTGDNPIATFSAFNSTSNKYYLNFGAGSLGPSPSQRNLANSVWAVKLFGPNGNEYKLKTYNCLENPDSDSTGNSSIGNVVGTFSRATTLSSAWGSGDLFPLTINATPQGNTYKVGFDTTSQIKLVMKSDGDAELDGASGKYLKQDIIIQEQTSSTSYVTRYTQRIYGINSTPSYNSGWNGARKRIADSIPYSDIGEGTNDNITVLVPNTDGVSTNTSYTYKMSLTSHTPPGSSAYKCVELKTSNNVVARLDINLEWNNQYVSGRTNGWDTARNSSNLVIPTSRNTNSSMSVTYPNTTYNTHTSRNYELVTDSDNVVVLRTNLSSTSIPNWVTVASYTHNKYTAGQNSVSASAPTYSSGPSAFSEKTSITVYSNTNTGKSSSGTITLSNGTYAIGSSGATNHCVKLQNGSTLIGLINTESVYNSGWKDGYDDSSYVTNHGLTLWGNTVNTTYSGTVNIAPGANLTVWPGFKKYDYRNSTPNSWSQIVYGTGITFHANYPPYVGEFTCHVGSTSGEYISYTLTASIKGGTSKITDGDTFYIYAEKS